MKKAASLSIILFLCLAMALSIIKADPQKPSIYVDPQNNTFSTDTTTVGTSFNVSIKGADWASPGLFSYQLELHYNNTLLEAVAAEIPADHWFKPSKPANIFVVDAGTISQDSGLVSFALTLLGDEAGKVGAGTICTISFEITQAPPAGGNVSCTLGIENIIMVDTNTAEIPSDQYDIVNGTYVYSAPAGPPVAKPAIYVDPKDNNFLTSTTSVGDNFTVSIKAANWTTQVFSYQLALHYNSTLLEAVDAKIPDDHWLKPSKPANIFVVDGGTINQTSGYVSFAVTLLGDEAGKAGSGTISTITFSIIQAPPADGSVSCPLEIVDIILVDSTTTEIPSDQYNIINGNYKFSAAGGPTIKEDLNGDGEVNIEDIAIWGAAFGSTPGHPRWNALTDMNSDGKIDMIDAVLIAKAWTD